MVDACLCEHECQHKLLIQHHMAPCHDFVDKNSTLFIIYSNKYKRCKTVCLTVLNTQWPTSADGDGQVNACLWAFLLRSDKQVGSKAPHICTLLLCKYSTTMRTLSHTGFWPSLTVAQSICLLTLLVLLVAWHGCEHQHGCKGSWTLRH